MKEKAHRLLSYTYDYLDRISRVVYNGSVSGESGSFSHIVDYTYRQDNIYGQTGFVDIYRSTVGVRKRFFWGVDLEHAPFRNFSDPWISKDS